MFSSFAEFLLIDATLYLFCAIVAFAVSMFSYRAYKISKEKNFLLFAFGFFILSVGIIARSIGNIAVFENITQCFFSKICGPLEKSFYVINLIAVAFTLYAYNLFIFVYSKVKAKVLMFLAFIETSFIALFLFKTFWFQVVGAVLSIFLIFLSAKAYKNKKSANSFLVMSAFIMLCLSHIFFSLNNKLAVYFGHGAEFLSFALFFIMLLRVKYLKIKKR